MSKRKLMSGLKELGVGGTSGAVATIAWEAGGERLVRKFGPQNGWFGPLVELLVGATVGPVIGCWMPRVGMGFGTALVAGAAQRGLEALVPSLFPPEINWDKSTNSWIPEAADSGPFGGAPTAIQHVNGAPNMGYTNYNTPTPSYPQGDPRLVPLQGAPSSMGDASSTTIVPLGGFADASPVLLERVMSAISG